MFLNTHRGRLTAAWGTLAGALFTSLSMLSAQTGVTLSPTPSPSAAQPGIQVVNVTGAGFPPGSIASNGVTVTLAPAAGGASAATRSTAVTSVSGTTRRVSFIVPSTISVATSTPYSVRISGATAAGVAFASTNAATLTVNPTPNISSITPSSAAPGSALSVTITTGYTNFVQGATSARFGAGIHVGGAAADAYGPVTVTSPTTAIAQLVIDPDAALGPRTVVVKTGSQQSGLTRGFSVGASTSPPAISATLSQPANQAGWHKSPVTVTFVCVAGGAAITSCPGPATVSQEGANQAVAGTVRDAAGNEASTSVTINLDLTPPTIVATPSATGWTNATVTVQFACQDPLSGVAQCQAPQSVSTEGEQTISGTAIDAAGNIATAQTPVTIDKTPPTIAASPDRPANAAGWYNAPVTIAFACADDRSGVAACPGSAVADEDGTAKAFTRTVTDRAGNSASATATINLDRVAPTVAIASPAEGAVLPSSPASVSGTVGDALSGVATATCSGVAASLSANAFACQVPIAKAQAIPVLVVDKAGNTGSASVNVSLAGANNAVPIARPGGPYSGLAQTAITFTGSASSDPDGDPLTYAWDFGDGGAATGVSPAHAYAMAGVYTVSLTVRDAAGATHTATTTATIARTNHAPSAAPGGPYSGDVNVPVSFDASASSDADGDPLTYAWDFGDGTTGSAQRPRHGYLTPGTFTAKLTVTDAFGGSNTAQAQVTIKPANQAPTADIGGPYTGTSGQPIGFSGVGSHDPDNDTLVYAWTFGDGGAATGREVAHAYASAGSFNVTLTVSDGRGGADSASALVPVSAANGAPVANPGGPYTGLAGRSIAFDGSGSSDPESDPLTYSWSFGDGGSRTGAQPTHVFDAAGTFTISLTVNDGHGGSNTAITSITVTAPTPADNHAPVASPGGPYAGEAGIPVAFTGAASSDPDGDALQYAWTFGDGGTATGVAPAHAFAQPGTYQVQLLVSDGRGGSHSSTVSAAIAAAADRIAPVVQLSGATRVLPGAQITVTATAVDNVSVAAVAFAVQGSEPSTSTAPPYQRTFSIPAVASPGTTIAVVATATDPSGNAGSASMTVTIVAEPDVTPPVVTLATPADTAPGATLVVGASATDASGIASVTFRVNGTQLPSSAAPYAATYAVPANAGAGTVLTITAEAVDFAGNHATASTSVTVAAAPDVTPPSVDLAIPSTSRPDAQVTLSAQAADAGGVASVTFTVDGVPVATITSAPYQTTFHVPPSAVAGMQFHVEAHALDFAGLQTADTASIQVVAADVADGVLTGEVYDDTRGLPIAGASVSVVSSVDAAAPPVVTDERGRYTLQVPGGDLQVRISKPGWSAVDRLASLTTGAARELFDARLTPLATPVSVAPVLGATLQAGDITAILPAGAVAALMPLTLTRIGSQGLAALLPAGWSPVVVADIAPAGVAFTTPATLRAASTAVAAGTALVFAEWDAQRAGWRAIDLQVAGAATQPLEALIDGSGQYAWLRADVQPVAPPAPVVGELLSGIAVADLPESLQTLVSPQPKVLVYEPGVRSDVAGTITAQTPVSSGTRLWARIVESYTFASAGQVHPEPFIEDLALYQRADQDTVLVATYPVTPSLVFEPATLQQGVVSVELLVPPTDETVHAIDANGGEVTLATGQRLTVPAGATSTALAAQLAKVTVDDIGTASLQGFEFVDGMLVSLSGATLAESAVLSTARPAGLPDGAQLLLARAETIQGATKLVFVGLGVVAADRVVSVAVLPKNKVPLEGVHAGGRYVFLRATSPVGFAAGQVLGTQGSALAGAQVSTEGLRLVSLSRAGGAYAAVAAVGTAKLTALDLAKSDTGFGQAAIAAAAAEVALDLRLVAQPPRIVSISPGEGTKNVPLSDPVTVLFSEPIDPASVATHVRLAKDGGSPIDVTATLSANGTTLTVRPVNPLAADTVYALTVEKVKDTSGYELATASVVHFTTLDTTAPTVPAGSISASIPENGVTTITGAQGAAGLHDTVTIENVTRGTSTPVLLDPNGGFVALVQASQTDVLKIKIADASGNETLVDVPRFTRSNPDGSLTAVVNDAGGRVDGPDGVAVDIDPGTFPEGTLVTIKPIAEAAFPVQLSPAQKQVFSYSGGVQLDFGGAEPKHYVDVSVAAAPADKASDQWIVAQAFTVDGVPTFNAVDMAGLESGRITTASPPCPGVTGQGVYGIYKSTRAVGLNYGEIFNNDVNGGLRLDIQALNVDVGGFAFPFPVITMTQRTPVCMPVLSGNVSIVENAVDLTIAPEHVTPADRAIQVTNTSVTPAAKYSFPRNILEYAFRVPGHEDDPFEIVVEKIDGTQVTLSPSQIASITKDAGASTVTIRLNMDKLTVTPRTFVFRNHFTTPPIETTFAEEVNAVSLSVAAAPGSTLSVAALDASGVAREVPFQTVGATYPSGNLALRAVRGTIDPTPAEIIEYNGWPACSATQPSPCRQSTLDPEHGVVRIVLADESSTPLAGADCGYSTCFEIPTSNLEHGALTFPFTGDRTHSFKLHIFYKDGTRDFIIIPGYRLLVTSTQTGEVIRRIVAQAPPRGHPLNLGTITNDTIRPVLIEGPQRFDNYDPSQPLSFTFSEAIDEASARNLVLRNAAGQLIPIASVVLSPDGKTVTFIPVSSLKLGEAYTVDFGDVTDAAGNKVLAAVIKMRTFAPRRLCLNDGGCQASDTGALEATVLKGFDTRVAGSVTMRDLEPIEDVELVRGRDAQGRLRTNLFLTLGGYETTDYRMSAFDVSDPRNAYEVGRDFGGRGKRREFLIQGLNGFRIAPDYTPGMPSPPYSFPPATDPCSVPNQLFTGNIAVMSAYTSEQSGLTFYNVTDPAHPCVLGDKLLTASPFALNDFNRKGTIHASGFARGVAAIKTQAGITVFTAVGEVGVTATDLAQNIPSRYPDARLQDGLYAGDVIDLKAFHDKLLIARRDEPRVEVLDVNLTPVAAVDLPERPVRIAVAEAFKLDANGDGQITQSELRNLAFVATDTCSWGAGGATAAGGASSACAAHLQVVDITTLSSPAVIGSYQLPGTVSSLDIDVTRQRLIVGGSVWQQYGGGSALYLIDVSKPDDTEGPDADGDGWDDRIVWRERYATARPNAVRMDTERGLAYVGLAYTTSTGRERGAVDIFALFDDCCDLGVDLSAEADDHESGPDVLEREVRALRAGIKQGLDKAQFGAPAGPNAAPVAACGAVAAARLAILEQGSGACTWRGNCDGTYQPGISDHDYEVFFPQMLADTATVPAEVKCTIDRLNDVFSNHKPVKFVNKLGLPDEMSFDDVTFYPVAMSELARARLGLHPPTAAGGSDPGGDLGMGRQQLLLKWLLEGEYVHGVSGYQLTGPDLEWTLQLLRTTHASSSPTGVPVVEGYEWARLMEYNLAKAKTYIRIKGAAGTNSGFHDLFVKQVHDAGKFGLRAALARMVAIPAENERAIASITRTGYRSGSGCVDMQPNQGSGSWVPKACASFEEYVASAAAKSPIFPESERQLIARFYRVKSDRETILTERAADAFIAATHAFVQAVKSATYPIYAQVAPVGAYASQRSDNMTALVGPDHAPSALGGKLQKELTKASLKLAPRFYNEGFRNADDVLTAMYRNVTAPGTGTEIKNLRISLAGGESRHVRQASDAGAPFVAIDYQDRNLNDLSSLDRDATAYQFVLGAGSDTNPSINQNAGFNVPETVVFTIDLPTRSGDPGHLVQEANRKNNYDGFTYYILDRDNHDAPADQPIPLPVPPSAIDPDPSCFTAPQIRVMSQNISYSDSTIHLDVQNISDEQLTNVQVCSDLAGRCVTIGTIGPGQLQDIVLAFDPPGAAGTYASNITIYGRTVSGQDVALRWSNTIVSAGSPFDIKAYDHTPLNALNHPFSRWTRNRDSLGQDLPVKGVTTDGTDKALRVRIDKLKPGIAALIRLVDADTRKIEEGVGTLTLGGQSGVEFSVTPDPSGSVELYYTPPSYFVRPGSAHQNLDFDRLERGARISVVQDTVGVSNADIALRRPPVFLAHGLFGTIHVWRDFQPLVPFTPPVGSTAEVQSALGVSQSNAQYYVPRPGYDGRFDLFVVGSPYNAAGFAGGADALRRDIGYSLQTYLPQYAVGKIDLIAHSLGGVLARKLTNEDVQVRQAVRKLILINSPQGGSPVADKIVEARQKLPLKIEDAKPFDLLDLDPGNTTPIDAAKVKVEWCSAALNSLGRTGVLNTFGGGVDDLRTPLKNSNGTLTEVGKIVFGEWEVPTHHIVDSTTQNDLGFSTEVTALWSGLGLLCNLTPDATTVEKTRLLQVGAEAIKTLASMFKGVNATRTMHNRPFGSLESKKILVDLFKGTLKQGLEEYFVGEPPVPVFTTPNDRVVPVWSQLGDGLDDGLPPGPLSLGHPAVTEVFGTTDHQAAKITPLIAQPMCKTVDGSGLVSFDTRVQDLNGDGTPDPTCRIMNVLEADPASTTFIKTGGQQ